MAMTKRDEQFLTNALDALERYCDPEDGHCGVPKEAREQSRLYLDTWVAERLRAVLHRKDHGGAW